MDFLVKFLKLKLFIKEIQLETNSHITKNYKDDIELDIKGDEKLEPPLGKFGQIVMTIWLILWVIAAFASLFSKGGDFIGALVIGGIVFLILNAFMKFLQMLTPSYWNYKNKSEKIKKYFEKRFDILKEFNPTIHTKLDAMRVESSEAYENVLFDIYMSAYKLNGDAIVIQELTREKGGKKYNLQATIVKYINNDTNQE